MAEMKSEDGLERRLGIFPVTNIVIANMIGAGIFTTSGLLMADLLNPWLMVSLWVVGGIIALCGALSYGELGAAIPRAGGEYAFLSKLYNPLIGFLPGWVSVFAGFSAPIAASAIGFTAYLTRAFPGLLHWGVFDPAAEAAILRKFYAIVVIFVFTVLHSRGLKTGAKVQNALTVLKVLLVVGLVVAGFMFGKGSFEHFSQGDAFKFDFGGWKTIALSLMWIMFAYSGWNASAYIGSEIKNPVRTLPRSLILGTGAVAVLYFFMNLFYVYAASPGEMIGPDGRGDLSIAGLAVRNLFGTSFESVLSVMISFALFSSLSAYIILGPRVYFSMAKDKYFFKFACDVDKKTCVPSKAILLQGGIAAVFVLLGTFDQILTYMGFSLGIFPILAVLGVFKLRRQKKTPFKMPGFPLVPTVYITFGALILILAFFERPVESSIAILTVLIGIPVFFILRRIYRDNNDT